MVAVSRMYSTVIPHDACIVLSSCMMHVLYFHPARFYKRPHRFGGEVFYLYCSLAALERALGLLERPQATGTATEKKQKNFRFWSYPKLPIWGSAYACGDCLLS